MTEPETVEVVDGEPVAESTELVIRQPVVHPRTAEVVTLDSPTETLAELRDAFVAVGHDLRDAARRLDLELAARIDFEGGRTLRVGVFTLKVPAPTKTSWNGRTAYVRLRALVRAGVLSDDAARRAVQRETVYRTTHGELKKLANHPDERVREAVAAAMTEDVVPDRRVSVSREPGAAR